MTHKKMGISILCVTICLLIIISSLTILFDPFFHYHSPFSWQKYTLNESNERYYNDGIARNFKFDAMITGTSMTENFKTSELDAIFNVQSIKAPFSGASYYEVDNFIKKAIANQPNLKMIIRSLDLGYIWNDMNYLGYEGYPDYLYDDNPFNDINYTLNKDVFLFDTFENAKQSFKNSPSTTFDEYANWNNLFTFSKQKVLAGYNRLQTPLEEKEFSDEDKKHIQDTITQNFIETAKANPNIQFFVFLPQNSIIYWDMQYMQGNLKRQLSALELATKLLLECENINVYSFISDFDTICNLDNYKDYAHYNENINTKILNHFKNKEYLVTKENFDSYYKLVRDFYTSYDYDSIFTN